MVSLCVPHLSTWHYHVPCWPSQKLFKAEVRSCHCSSKLSMGFPSYVKSKVNVLSKGMSYVTTFLLVIPCHLHLPLYCSSDTPSLPPDLRTWTLVLSAWNSQPQDIHPAHSLTSLISLLKCYLLRDIFSDYHSITPLFLAYMISSLSAYTWALYTFYCYLLPLQCKLHGGRDFVLFIFLQRALILQIWHLVQTQ